MLVILVCGIIFSTYIRKERTTHFSNVFMDTSNALQSFSNLIEALTHGPLVSGEYNLGSALHSNNPNLMCTLKPLKGLQDPFRIFILQWHTGRESQYNNLPCSFKLVSFKVLVQDFLLIEIKEKVSIWIVKANLVWANLVTGREEMVVEFPMTYLQTTNLKEVCFKLLFSNEPCELTHVEFAQQTSWTVVCTLKHHHCSISCFMFHMK